MILCHAHAHFTVISAQCVDRLTQFHDVRMKSVSVNPFWRRRFKRQYVSACAASQRCHSAVTLSRWKWAPFSCASGCCLTVFEMLQRASAVLISVMEYERRIAWSRLPTWIPSPLIRADTLLFFFYKTLHNLKPPGYRLIYLMRERKREIEREGGRKNVKRRSLTGVVQNEIFVFMWFFFSLSRSKRHEFLLFFL